MMAHLEVDSEGLFVIDRLHIKDSMAQLAGGSVVEDRKGVHYLGPGEVGYRPQMALGKEFAPVEPEEKYIMPALP